LLKLRSRSYLPLGQLETLAPRRRIPVLDDEQAGRESRPKIGETQLDATGFRHPVDDLASSNVEAPDIAWVQQPIDGEGMITLTFEATR